VAFVRLFPVVHALDSGVEPGSDLRGITQGMTKKQRTKKGAKSKDTEGKRKK
jgi:hypothetical protein